MCHWGHFSAALAALPLLGRRVDGRGYKMSWERKQWKLQTELCSQSFTSQFIVWEGFYGVVKYLKEKGVHLRPY